jgi:hypothetical protein
MNISENVTFFWTLLLYQLYSIRVAATCTPDLTFWLTLAFGLNLNAHEISSHLSHTSYLLTLMQKKIITNVLQMHMVTANIKIQMKL